MKTKRIIKFMHALLLVAMLMAGTLSSHGQAVPTAINYQGKLTDSLGNPLDSGYYEIQFTIWGDATSTADSEVIWGRIFALHVVEGGLFNILLTNDGTRITDPTPEVDSLLDAFADDGRYLGLTIWVDPSGNVSSPTEISPRQQLASAVYSIKAYKADLVEPNGVESTALQKDSVVTEKIASNAITPDKIAANAVTTAKIADGNVTSAKLNIDGDVYLNDHTLFLATGTANGLRWTNSFGGETVNGPALFGNTGGVLGTTSGGEKAALAWNDSRDVTLEGNATTKGTSTLEGAVSLFGSFVDLEKHFASDDQEDFTTYGFTAKVEGLLMHYSYGSYWEIHLFAGTNNETFLHIDSESPLGKMTTWPMKVGDKVTIKLLYNHNNDYPNKLFFLPLGSKQGASANDVMTFTTN